jgi:hypothetical protein
VRTSSASAGSTSSRPGWPCSPGSRATAGAAQRCRSLGLAGGPSGHRPSGWPQPGRPPAPPRRAQPGPRPPGSEPARPPATAVRSGWASCTTSRATSATVRCDPPRGRAAAGSPRPGPSVAHQRPLGLLPPRPERSAPALHPARPQLGGGSSWGGGGESRGYRWITMQVRVRVTPSTTWMRKTTSRPS